MPDAHPASESWRSFSHVELEREYSPSSCVPDGDIGPYLQTYADRSTHARDQVGAAGATLTELRYGVKESQTLDVAVPGPGVNPAPVVVYFHGGYWQQLSKRDSFFAANDSVEHGVAFAAVGYTLAPEASLDEIVAECHAALRALRSEAERLGIDGTRIFVAGSSAGAHLAAMVARGHGDDDWQPAGCCLVSGVYDLRPLITTYINDAVKLDLEAAERNSPLLLPAIRFPPSVLAVGTNETAEFKRQNDAMAAALRARGARVQQLEVDARNHFDVILDLCNRESPLGAAFLDLIAQPGAIGND